MSLQGAGGAEAPKVEPQHEMYLNIYNDGVELVDDSVEPQHEMYLNISAKCFVSASFNVEPQHEMYLNKLIPLFDT